MLSICEWGAYALISVRALEKCLCFDKDQKMNFAG
jgi:hypothetical protein